jgi:hypothetical protein
MFDGSRPSVEEFIREVLPAVGADSEAGSDGATWVMLPGEPELRRITFESEAAREEPEMEWAGHGSRFVDDLIRLAYSREPLSRAWVGPYLRPPPESGFTRAYALKAKRVDCAPWTERAWTTWVFAFGIGLEGEFRRESTLLCAVDAASGRFVRRFEQPLSRLPFLQEGPPCSAGRSFEECYRLACGEATQQAGVLFRAGQRESQGVLEGELACLNLYYNELSQEMEADLARGSAQDPRRAAVASRMEATRLEREHAVLQLRERYRLGLEVEVVGALGVIYPRWVRAVALSDNAGPSHPVEAVWDPLFEHFDALSCPSCSRPTYLLEFDRGRATCGCSAS